MKTEARLVWLLFSWELVALHLMKKGLSFWNQSCSFILLMMYQEVFYTFSILKWFYNLEIICKKVCISSNRPLNKNVSFSDWYRNNLYFGYILRKGVRLLLWIYRKFHVSFKKKFIRPVINLELCVMIELLWIWISNFLVM